MIGAYRSCFKNAGTGVSGRWYAASEPWLSAVPTKVLAFRALVLGVRALVLGFRAMGVCCSNVISGDKGAGTGCLGFCYWSVEPGC